MILFGHRGAAFEAPENTIPGFRHLLAVGVEAVEFDVQLTADGELVVIHDATVDRTTDGVGAISSLTLAGLRQLNAGVRFPDWPDPCRIPTLGETLEVVRGVRRILLEIKPDTPERIDLVAPAVVAAIRAYGLVDRVMISSFDPYALERVAECAPEIPRAINGAWREPDTRDRALQAGCTGADFDYRQVGRDHIEWARANGLWIIGWPCNSDEDLAIQREYRVDAIGSDCPSTILPLLAENVIAER